MANKNPSPAASKDKAPLPCRGCTADCSNITKCNGRPWRQEKEQLSVKPNS